MTRARRAVAAPAAAALLALAACSGSPSAAPPPASTPTPRAEPAPVVSGEYVALGDSYTAGPLVPETDLADGCLRSDGNYPSLLADRLDLELTDVSCSGATTADLAAPQSTVRAATVPAQLDALSEDTELVTVGIGGNDSGLFTALVRTCLGLRAENPTGSPCADSPVGQDLLTAAGSAGAAVRDALGQVRERAPQARVVLVGYPRITPTEGACPRRLPFADGDVAFGDRVMRTLDAQLEGAAAEADVEYLDLYDASAGHDVCSDQPWVNGAETRPGFALAYHPTPAGMRGVAAELEALLRG